MSIPLTTDKLLRSVGEHVLGDQGKYLGEIIEVTRSASGKHLEYAILKSNQLFDNEERFFAIPVCFSFIKITEMGDIALLASKEDLHFADATVETDVPHQNLSIAPIIMELFDYKLPR